MYTQVMYAQVMYAQVMCALYCTSYKYSISLSIVSGRINHIEWEILALQVVQVPVWVLQPVWVTMIKKNNNYKKKCYNSYSPNMGTTPAAMT